MKFIKIKFPEPAKIGACVSNEARLLKIAFNLSKILVLISLGAGFFW